MKSATQRQWWFTLILVLLMGTMLGACGGAGTPAGQGEATPAGEETAPEPTEAAAGDDTVATPATDDAEPTEAAAGDDTVATPATDDAGGEMASGAVTLNQDVSGEVEFWHFWGSPVRRQAIRRVVALCQAQLPNVTITEVLKPFGDIWTANVAAVAAGSGMPDVIVEDRPQLPQRAADGIATNLGEFAERDGIDGSAFYPFAWQETLYEGDPYGIPFETDVRVLYWNKNAFEQAGLDPEDPPETWEEYEEIAAQLTVGEGDEFERIGGFPLWNVGPDFWAYTNGWTAVVDGVPNINSPEYIETLEWVQGFVERYGGWQNIQNFNASFGAAPNDKFMSGAVPMIIETGGYSSQLNFFRPRVANAAGDGTEELRWGIAHVPYKKEQATWSGGFALSIPLGAENSEAAWEFIKCATGPEGQGSWARDTAATPTNINVANDPVLMSDPNWQTIMAQMEFSRGSTYVPAYPNWNEQVGPRLEELWNGDLTPEEMAEQTQDAINQTIEDNQ